MREVKEATIKNKNNILVTPRLSVYSGKPYNEPSGGATVKGMVAE
jgi:hypothetical protein